MWRVLHSRAKLQTARRFAMIVENNIVVREIFEFCVLTDDVYKLVMAT